MFSKEYKKYLVIYVKINEGRKEYKYIYAKNNIYLKTHFFRPSRNRTYIGNLEGFCPNPLDDRP